MANYYSIISTAVSQLGENTPANRLALYARAKASFAGKIVTRSPLTNEQITRARRDLDDAIRRVESEQTRNQAPPVGPNSAAVIPNGRPESTKEETSAASTNPAKLYDFEIFETTKPADPIEPPDETTNGASRNPSVEPPTRVGTLEEEPRVVRPTPQDGIAPGPEIQTGSDQRGRSVGTEDSGNSRSDREVSLSQRRTVVDALNRLRSNTNGWEVVYPIPVIGAIGFALELPLYDYLTNPENAEVPNGAAALCVFHKNYYPAAQDREHWQVPSELHEAYADRDRNTFLQLAEQTIAGTPRITRRILYKRAMEFGCMTLLKQLGYDVEPLKASGTREGSIDIVAKRPPEAEQETNRRVVAVECKTTRRGFDNEQSLIQRVRAALKRSRKLDEVRKVRTLIDRHNGVFDYLIVSNRDFKSSDFRNYEGSNREGYFILRGLEIQ